MSREDPHFRLRIPSSLRDRIAEGARVNKRSINAEIVARLEWSFEPGAGARFIRAGEETISIESLINIIQAGVMQELKNAK